MPTAVPQFTHDTRVKIPGTALVTLAASCMRALHDRHAKRYAELNAKGEGDSDEAIEEIENLTDVEIILREVDPAYWKILCTERTGADSDERTVGNHDNPPEQHTLGNLLTLGKLPKASWVVPKAVAVRRETREAGVKRKEKEKEDVLLDFLVFLAEKRERAGLLVAEVAPNES